MKQIKLKPYGVTCVDDLDYEYLSKEKWYLSQNGYVIGGNKRTGRKSFMKIHRLIMDAKDGELVDHIDHDKLNNVRSNLRIVGMEGNVHNQHKRKNTKNNFKGVTYVKRLGLFQSRCRIFGGDYFLGYFKTEIAAAYAYNKKATELSEFTLINNLPFSKCYLEKILISDRKTIEPAKERSKYKYILFKKAYGTQKKDKWFICFSINNIRTYKGYFLTDEDAHKYLISNYIEMFPKNHSFIK
jgi:hypothetical protein